jgi:hypothetical protein
MYEWCNSLFTKCYLYVYLRAGIAQAVRWLRWQLDDTKIVVRFAVEERICLFCLCPGGLLEPSPPSYLTRTSFSFPRIEQPGREVDHLTPSSAEVKNDWRYTSTPPFPPVVFMAYSWTTLLLLCIRVYWYLTVLLAAHITQCPTAGWLTKNELEKLWTEATVQNLRYHSEICLARRRKTAY